MDRSDLWAASLEDLRDDLALLTALTQSARRRLLAGFDESRRTRRHLHPAVQEETEHGLGALMARYDGQLRQLEQLTALAESPPSRPVIAALEAALRRHASLLRSRQAPLAALLAGADWHSPSIHHTTHSQAGRHTGRVEAHRDDYKRDRHPEAAELEQAWLREYVDNPHRHRLRALATGCGMSAFTTILWHLASERRTGGAVLMGASTYHECRELLETGPLAARIVVVPEGDAGWETAVRDRRPQVVVVDSLCNAPGLAVPDVEGVVARLVEAGRPAHLVIDNSGRSVTLQTFAHLPPSSPVRPIVFESLTKYAQFGFDRTAAGMIVATEEDASGLDACREHLGTNITDLAACQLPTPDRRLLEARLRRIGRNAELLARSLAERARPGWSFAVTYPGLPGHPSYQVASRLRFKGGLLALDPLGSGDEAAARQQLLKAILYEARRRRVPLVEGTSFGFDLTRLYLTAGQGPDQFLRAALGTEHRLGVEALTATFAAALDS